MIHAALPVVALALMTKPSSTPVCCEPPPAAWNWSAASGSSPGAVFELRMVATEPSVSLAERLPAKWPEMASTW